MSNQQYSYRPNMNRNVTRKWAEARQVDYGGDDWGDDPYGSYEEQPIQPPLSQDRRSYTNPPASSASHRMSFDRGDEYGGYPVSNASGPAFHGFQNSQLGAPRYYEQHQDYAHPPRQQTMPLQSMHMNREPDMHGRSSMDSYRDAPRPDSRSSNSASRPFPPRKSSLSQTDFAPSMARAAPPATVPATTGAGGTSKPLPFVRPADIYRRLEEEREKERQSQESSRPSMDSINRDTASGSAPLPQGANADVDTGRRRQPALDTVAERKSEYGLENKFATTASGAAAPSRPIQPIDTSLPQQTPNPSASSKYTDRSDPASSTTGDSHHPSRPISQQFLDVETTSSMLPQINRVSGFGSDFMPQDSSSSNDALQSYNHPSVPSNDALGTVPEDLRETQHKTPHGYRSMINDAFEAENRRRDSTTASQDSVLRSDTTSTSDISPIMDRSRAQPWDRSSQQPLSEQEQADEELPMPRRLDTQRRDSPSPASRPFSVGPPDIPEPQSAITVEDAQTTKDTATRAHMMRPGPAILVHQQPRSRDSIDFQYGSAATQSGVPTLQKQESQASGISDLRTTSEEWRDWSEARREFKARHGIQDSNPTTPGIESSDTYSRIPDFDSLDRNVRSFASNESERTPKASAINSLAPSSRPLASRDESFRPSLPGGWLSSTSVARSGTPEASIASTISSRRPAAANDPARTESSDSLPTATAPKGESWRSEYNGIQAQAFAAAATAGSALAVLFHDPSLTSSTTGDSEVSSINESDGGLSGKDRESGMTERKIAEPHPVSDPGRDVARTTPGSMETTPVAGQRYSEDDTPDQHGSTPTTTKNLEPAFNKHSSSIKRDDSPSKVSERWWSDEDDDDNESHSVTGGVPAPLRTSRMIESKNSARPAMPYHDSEDGPDPEQLETDIMTRLTPKSSSIHRHHEFEPQKQFDRHEDTGSSRPTSAPFAAAALALSPSRQSRSLQEQNDFKPLQASQIEEQTSDGPGDGSQRFENVADPSSFRTTEPPAVVDDDQETLTAPIRPMDTRFNDHGAAPSAGGIVNSTRDTTQPRSEDNQTIQSLTSRSNMTNVDYPASGQATTSPGPTRNSESPAFTRLNSSSKKEFSIMSDVPGAFPSGQKTYATGEQPTNQAFQQPAVPRNDERTPPALAHVENSHSAQNEAETISTPAYEDEDKDLAHVQAPANQVHNYHDQSPAAVSDIDEDESRSFNTPTPAAMPNPESPTSRTIVSDTTARPSTPVSKPTNATIASPPAGGLSQEPSTTQLSHPYDPNTAFPSAKIPVAQISGMVSAQQRIKAYNDNRDTYVQPIGHLESWLSMMNTSEHADIFSGQRPAISQYGTPPRSHYGRESNGVGGNKHMQEDGRRLLEGAKKKASVLGKGLLSKGKEKLRTVSANNKGTRKASFSTEPSQHSSASISAPKLPTPLATTPIDESNLSQYFATKQPGDSGANVPGLAERSTAQPPFSPISQVSTRATDKPSTPYRTVSTVSQDQTPRSLSTAEHPATTSVDVTPQSPADVVDKRKSTAAVSVTGSEHYAGRTSTGMLNPGGDDGRRDSSVSDVSSVSDQPRRQSMAARTVSPPIEHQAPRNIDPYTAGDIQPTISPAVPDTTPTAERADKNRLNETALTEHTQPYARSPTVRSGAQIVPMSQLGQDQLASAEQTRPFSFVGNESLMHSGQQRAHAMDSLNAQTRDLAQQSNADTGNIDRQATRAIALDVAGNPEQGNPESPLPSARRPPEELAKYRPVISSSIPQDEEGGFRIPGPYTRELRPTRPKSQSPIKEQVQPDYPSSNTTREAVPDTPAAAESVQPGHSYQPPVSVQQQPEQHEQRYLQQQLEPETNNRTDGGDRGRNGSKFGDLFRTQSRSQSRRQPEAERSRPELDQRRSSLFKFGSRNSTSSRGPETEQHNEVADQQRPQSGPRKLSRDLFKLTTFTQSQSGQANFGRSNVQGQEQSMLAPNGKKKRFSGLFTRSPSNEQYQQSVPSRSSTLPPNASHPDMQSQSLYNQHPANQQRFMSQPGQQFQGMEPPREGYYGQPQAQQYGDQAQQFGQSHQQSNQLGQLGSYQGRQVSNQQQSQNRPAPAAAPFYSLATSPTTQDQGRHPHAWHQETQRLYTHDPQQHQQYQSENMGQYSTEQRPDLRVDTGDRPLGLTPASAPPVPNSYLQSRQTTGAQAAPLTAAPHSVQPQSQIPSTRANKDISYRSDLRHGTASPVDQYAQPGSSQQASNITPRVQALHTRSRSPKLGRPTSEDLTEEFNGLAPAPANDLGTFSNKKVSPVGGVHRSPEDQEKPWTIGLPGEDIQSQRNPDSASATSSRQREIKRIMLEKAGAGNNNTMPSAETEPSRPQTVAEKFMGHGMPPSKSTTRPAQVPVATSTSTPAGDVPGPRRSFSNVSISKNASLRGKGPTVSRSGTPVGNASAPTQPSTDFATYYNKSGPVDSSEERRGQPSDHNDATGSSMTGYGAPPTRSTDEASPPPTRARTWDQTRSQTSESDLGRSATGERNKHYPAGTILDLANQNRNAAAKGHEQNSQPQTMDRRNEQSTQSGLANDRGSRSADTGAAPTAQAPPTTARPDTTSDAPAVSGHVNRDPSLSGKSPAQSSYPHDPRASLTNGPTPPPPEARPVRAPLQTSKAVEIHELVGSRPEGYESDDEPMMSATAYPGQEWQPVFDKWDD